MRLLLAGGAVIALVAAALLSLPREVTRTAACESHAVSRLRSIAQEQNHFRAAHDGFAERLEQLDNLALGRDYVYAIEVVSRDEKGRVTKFVATAAPSIPGKSGVRYFSIDETGALRTETMHPVNASSPTLE